MRFSDARLQAESSRNMYSEQGLEALMRAVFGQVCQALMVVSNCMPGSPHSQAASAIWRMRSRAADGLERPAVGAGRAAATRASSTTACMNSSVTRTEWLAFWKKTES